MSILRSALLISQSGRRVYPLFLPTEMLYRLTVTMTWLQVAEVRCGYPVLYRYDMESPKPAQSLLFFSFLLCRSYFSSGGPSSFPCASQ